MTQTNARTLFRQLLIEGVRFDERIVGLLQGGSGSEGRADQWSDLDVFLFIRDTDLEVFLHEWKQWVQPYGHLLLGIWQGFLPETAIRTARAVNASFV